MGLFSLLFSDPLLFIATILAMLFSLSFHEAAHGYVAYWLGDETAKRSGRLTLNPLAHLDPLGFLALLFVGFGWAKPVPFNPYNLRYKRWGSTIVALAGPASNLILGIITALIFRGLSGSLSSTNLLMFFLLEMTLLNFGLMLFNLIPLPPLDGSKLLLAILEDHRYQSARRWIELQGPNLLLMLIVLDAIGNIGIFNWLHRIAIWLFQLFANV